jgi:ElaB/YqjD/DUF883 family membrane-anchored ribosome-binding protein
MDQAASDEHAALTSPKDAGHSAAADRSPQELRRDIEQTRAELGDTVEALAEKADVKGQAQEQIASVKNTARQKKDELLGRVRETTPQSVQEQVQQLATTAQQKPTHTAASSAFVGGLVLGWLLGRRGG